MAAPTVTNYDDYIHEPNCVDLDHIPGTYGWPVIGESPTFLTDPFQWAQTHYERWGPVSRMNNIGGRGVLVLGPDLMQRIFLDPGRDFSSKMGFMDRVTKFFDGSMIMEDFEHHKHQRRIMQTAFKNESLKHYTHQINAIYDRALSDWEGHVGGSAQFFLLIKQVLLEVAAEIFIGEAERGPRMDRLNKAFVDCVSGTMYMVPVNLPGFALHRGMRGKAWLKQYFGEKVPLKRASEDLDMLAHFCREKDEHGNYFSDEEICNQAIFLLFAAHDTTTSAITHTIYYLARHPEMKQRLYEECVATGKTALTYEDLGDVPYMQMVFNEVQRIRPSVPILPRRTIREVELGGYRIPAHTMVYAMPRFTHHMPEYWTDPERFDPDRFSPERAEHKRHAFAYHPFGGGAHKCIGMHFSQMEYKCFMHKFMLKYDFEARHKKPPHMESFPLPKPRDGMPVSLRLR